MTNRKTTRRALVLSLLSLLLCCSMLVGTTFAWFTDSVQSGKNTIVAGNLDIELEYSKDFKTWNSVAGKSDLIDPNALWEPGHTEVVYLSMSNQGTLALKYQFSMNFTETEGVSVNGNKILLSQHLKYGIVEVTEPYTSREAAREDVAKNNMEKTLSAYTDSGEMEGKTDSKTVTKTMALVIWMPETVGNEANYRGTAPQIDLGLTLVATQLTAEKDSFGSDYDTDATYPIVNTVYTDGTAAKEITAGEVTVTIPEGKNGNYTTEVTNKQVYTANGETTVTFDINLLKDGVKVASNGTMYTVSINVGKNLDVTAVTHNGVELAFYHYDPATGVVTFETDSFSPFAVIYKTAGEDSVFTPSTPEAADKLKEENVVAVDEAGNGYTTLKAAVDSGASKLYLKAGADLGTVTHLDVDHDLTIYGNGAYISDGERDLAIDTYKHLTKDITVAVYNLHGVAFWGQRNTAYTANLKLYNCNDVSRVYINGTSGVNNIELVNCTATKAKLVGDTVVYSNANGKITVDGCTITGIGCPINLNHKIAGEQTVIVKNSKFVDCATEGTAAYYAPVRLYNSVAGANQTLTVEGNTFTYSEGKAPVNGADVLLNAKHNDVDATGTIEANVQANAAVVTGANVSYDFTVSNAQELAFVASEINKVEEYEANIFDGKTVKLVKDIDLGGAEWAPIGNFGNTSKQFTGVFDGQGHVISNFKITQKTPDRPGKDRSPHGFFGNVNGTVKNLTLDKAVVDVKNAKWAGALVGRLNGGSVENCHVTNSSVTIYHWQVGGVIGQLNSGSVSGCSISNSTVTGYAQVGGIVGVALQNGERTIENCVVKNTQIVQNGTFGTDYDEMFGAVVGALYSGNLTVNVNNCKVEKTTIQGEASNTVCGHIEDGDKLYVDGFEVIADGLAKNGTTYNVSNANGLVALNAMMGNKTAGRDVVVELTADIDMTGKTWTTVDSHVDFGCYMNEINGNGHTISNMTVSGQAMFTRFAGTGDVVIKDITFDNAVVSSTGINCSVLTVQTYQNVLLDNVDVKNSSITGSYKVAPLIATVYNESPSAITATIKNCDVSDTTVTATQYDFCTAGMVAFVYESNNDSVKFENCTVTNVKLYAPAVYSSHAWVYVNDADTDDCFNNVEGVTVTGCTFENK